MSFTTRKSRSLAATVGLVALMGVGAAHAADVVEQAPEPAMPMEEPPVASWTGAYAGLTLGYGFAGRANDRTTGNSISTDGFVGGAFVGYNYDTGTGIVAGLEGDVGYSGVDGSNAGTEVKSGVDGSLRARLGYAVSPQILLYTTAGGAAKRVSVTEGGIKDSNTAMGWTAGVGTDVKVTDNIFARAEYRYSDYGRDTYLTGSGLRDVDSRDHKVQFGVGFSF